MYTTGTLLRCLPGTAVTNPSVKKKLSCRRGTVRRAVSVETLQNFAQMFVELHLKKSCDTSSTAPKGSPVAQQMMEVEHYVLLEKSWV